MTLNPNGDFAFDGMGQQCLCSVSKGLGRYVCSLGGNSTAVVVTSCMVA